MKATTKAMNVIQKRLFGVTALTVLLCTSVVGQEPPSVGSAQSLVMRSVAYSELGRDLQDRIEREVTRATAQAHSGQRNARRDALALVDSAEQVVRQAAKLSEWRRQPVLAAIDVLKTSITAMSEVPMATLTVRVFREPDDEMSTPSVLAGAGVTITVNGVRAGTTAADGTATIQVPAKPSVISATLYPSNFGQANVTLSAGETGQADIILLEGKEISEDTTPILKEAEDGVLPSNFATFTIRFDDVGRTVPIAEFEWATLYEGGAQQNLPDDSFTVNAVGELVLSNPGLIRDFVANRDQIVMELAALDTEGRTHRGAVQFKMGLSGLSLATTQSNSASAAPPSYATAKLLGSDITLHAIADASGHVTFDHIPPGAYEVTVERSDRPITTERVSVRPGEHKQIEVRRPE